jgi:hypothetical protein
MNKRMAQEISKNGIKCKAITDIGSLPIERRTFYSHLSPLSPRVTTNRSCIRLEGNSKRNIDYSDNSEKLGHYITKLQKSSLSLALT